MKKKTIKNFFSSFSGIGGIELGIYYANNHRQKLKKRDLRMRKRNDASDKLVGKSVPVCVGYSEIDAYAIEIYKKHFPDHKNYGDITKIKEEDLPAFDLFVGGFPCQSFSIAGKRRGFADTRGTLFFDVARILQAKKPRLCLLENVKGLLSHDGGRTFRIIIRTLTDLGYDLQWQVLNSKDFGVPQNRERIFIVGHIRGTPRPEVFPLKEGNGAHTKKDAKIAYCLDAHYSKGTAQRARTAIIYSYPHGGFKGGTKEFPNLQAHSGAIHNEVVLPAIRRLTPTECERLQGFPDGWTTGVSDTQRYKCLGNAVTVNVIQAIMEKLL